MVALVAKGPTQVTNRLAELGWSVDDLLEVVSAMVRARNACTDNHPAGAPGWFAWAEGTRRLRELALQRGLVRADADGIPWTLDKVRGVRFAVANTDDATCIQGYSPQNCSKKGPGTDRAVEVNQTSLFDYLPACQVAPISQVPPNPSIVLSWYLCVYCSGDIVRAELSCPIETVSGYFADFSERIFLLGGEAPDGFTRVRSGTEDGSEFEINISRK